MVAAVLGPCFECIKAPETAGAAPCFLSWEFEDRAIQVSLTQATWLFATWDTSSTVGVEVVLR